MATSNGAAKRYGEAVFALARERGELEAVGADLGVVSATLLSDPEIGAFFASPVIQRAEKSAALVQAFEGRVSEVTLNLLLLLVQKRREALISAIAEHYAAALRAARGETPLTVVSPRAFSESSLAQLKGRLDAIFHKDFLVSQRVEPALIGGLQLQFDDRRYDGSLDGRLAALASQLL